MSSLSAEVVEIGGEAFTMTFENVVPPIEPEQLAGLDASIKEEGVKVPVIRDQHGRVIDGYNRLRLAIKHGKASVPVEQIEVRDDAHAKELAIVLNLQRRHMNSKQRVTLAELLLTLNPDKSNRQIAEEAGVAHTTVGRKREELERRGAMHHVDTVTDTKGRKQPAKRKSRKSPGQKAGEAAQAVLNGQEREPGEEGDEETQTAEEPAELLDQAGQPLPPQAREAFNQLPELRKLLHQMDQLAKEIERVGKMAVGFHTYWQSARAHIRDAKSEMRSGQPAYVCPYCRGDKEDCRACKGRGFVTTTTYENAPPEMKAIERAEKDGAE
jgi:ParB-like chromosome segregation protein Spo0J